MQVYTRRRIVNVFNLTVATLATVFGLFWLVWLLVTLVGNGLSWIDWTTFTQVTPPPGNAGGLANAIVGSLLLTSVGVLVGTPVGILAGTYLSEFSAGSKLASVTRFINDVLLSAPSIIIGVFVYETVVLTSGHFSGWAGGLALALIVIPVVVRTTENMLR